MKMKNFKIIILAFMVMFSFINVSLAADTSVKGKYGTITLGETTTSISTEHSMGDDDITNLQINYISGGVATPASELYYYVYQDLYRAERNDWLILYCIDANALSADNSSSGVRLLQATSFLLRDDSKSIHEKAYETALLSILTNDESYNASKSITANSIAIRAVVALFNDNLSQNYQYFGEDGSYQLYVSYFKLAHDWIKNYAYSSYQTIYNYDNRIKTLSELESGSITVGSTTYGYNDYILTKASGSNDYVEQARKLFVTALEDVADYLESTNSTDEPSVTVKVETGTKTEINANLIAYEQPHTFTLTNFTDDDEANFTITKLSYDDGYTDIAQNLYISKIEVNDVVVYETSTASSDILNKNILDLDGVDITDYSNIKITVYVYSEAKYNVSSGNQVTCDTNKPKYTLTYNYNDSKLSGSNKYLNYIGVIWHTMKVSSNAIFQRYISIEPIADIGSDEDLEGLEGTSSGEMKFLECVCDVLLDECLTSIESEKTVNTDACNNYKLQCKDEVCNLEEEVCNSYSDYVSTSESNEACEYYEDNCDVKCNTSVSANFECCDAYGKVLIEGNNKEISITGPTNVTACFANDNNPTPVDDVGNSYVYMSNEYCTVSCKEDYTFYMPTSRLANSIRYFTFDMTIKGTKTCYTNKINNEQFNKDIIEAQEAVIDAYNDWQKWTALATSDDATRVPDSRYTNSFISSTDSCWDYLDYTAVDVLTCINGCDSSTYYLYWAASATVSNWVFYTPDYSTGTISINTGKMPVTDDANEKTTYQSIIYYDTEKIPRESGSDADCVAKNVLNGMGGPEAGAACMVTCGGYSYNRYTVTDPDENGYILVLKNRATKAAQTLTDKINDYYDYISKYNSCFEWDNIYNYDENNPSISYTYGDELFYLINQSGTMDRAISKTDNGNATVWACEEDLTNGQYTACSVSPSSFKDYNITSKKDNAGFIICSTTGTVGCKEDTSSSSKVYNYSYVKKTSTVTDYARPATLFYYKLDGSGVVTTKDSDTQAMNNSLAISQNVSRDIYYYGIKITNLGEYYDTQESGRLVGGHNPVGNLSTFKQALNISDNILTYDCSYLVNMGTVDNVGTIACKYDACSGPNCKYTCTGQGCSVCKGDTCKFLCIGTGCIYDEGEGSAFYERQIKLAQLFPNGTSSRNWDVSASNGLASKASATIQEIETQGEEIYNTSPILSVTISPSAASEIVKYNKEHESKGGYSNLTLSCYDLNGYVDGACYSSFITDLLESEGKYGTVNETSKIQSYNGYRKEGNTSGNAGEYFVSWSGVESDVVGPSWK